jgi:type IV secretion system protein VirB1
MPLSFFKQLLVQAPHPSIVVTCLIVTSAILPLPSSAKVLSGLLVECSPKVHSETLGAIVRTESNGHVYAVSDDGPRDLPWAQRKYMLRSFRLGTAQEAAELARSLISQGHLVGMGLTQVNSQHLPKLGVSIEQLFDPCTNLMVGGQILSLLYEQALRRFKDEQTALRAAISAFNTGNFYDGLRNGYVAKVVANARDGIPALRTAAGTAGKNRNRTPRAQPKAPAPRQIILPTYGGVQEPLIAGS